jgi:hypothetical protein
MNTGTDHDAAELRRLLEIEDTSRALGWDAVHAFEARHGILVPEPYRTFVAEVADGSPLGPPTSGLIGLRQLPGDWGAGRPERDLAAPFPLTEVWVWEDDETTPEDELDEAVGRVQDHGSIVLGTDGCGMYWHLVVSGAQRGRIWCVTDVGAVPTAEGFLEWVRSWAAAEDLLSG